MKLRSKNEALTKRGIKMKKSICGINCEDCPSNSSCRGCSETNGCPFGKDCYIAKYILTGGFDAYCEFKSELIDEINAFEIGGMEKVTDLVPLVGAFVNIEYPLENGSTVKFLKDDEVYLGAQVKNLFDDSGKSCYGVVARESFILICSYGENGENPEIVLYKRR